MTAAAGADLLGRLAPVVTFLLAITVTAELAERAGVFDVAGHAVARLGGGRRWLLWVLFAGLAVLATIVLSLDTTAVLLTPVGLAVATQVGLDPRLLAVTTLWIANTGSLLLPVSNLTNLLALHTLGRSGLGHGDYVRTAWAPAVAAVVVTLALVAALHRGSLRGRYSVAPGADPHDVVLLRVAGTVCLVIGPLFALGASPWLVAVGSAGLLAAVTWHRDRPMLRGLPVPWLMAAGFVAVSVAVEVLQRNGLDDLVTRLVPSGTGVGALAATAAAGAVLSNVVNNLPAYLALEPAAGGSVLRLVALLVGTNAGPLVTPWASLATLLWIQRCRARGVVVPWRWLAPAGLLCAVLVVGASSLALATVG